jgi:hypothetical protein
LHSVEEEKKPVLNDESKKQFQEFVKSHSSRFLTKKEGSVTGGNGKRKVSPIIIRNRFIYKSKILLYSFLQKSVPVFENKKVVQKEMVFGIKPSLDYLFTDVMNKDIDGMFSDSSVETASQNMSYKTFKSRCRKDTIV